MKISILELHFRHEKLSVGGFGGQNAFLKAAAAVVEVLYLDVGEDAHGAWREAGIEVGEEGKIVFIQFRQLFFHTDKNVVKIGIDKHLKFGYAL